MPHRIAAALLLASLVAGTAAARPPHKQTLKRYYGDRLADRLFACTTCHLPAGGATSGGLSDEAPPHNVFGDRLRVLGEERFDTEQPTALTARLRQVADEDADGDGAANELEFLSGHGPGDPADAPTVEELAAAVETRTSFLASLEAYQWTPFQPVARPAVPQVAFAAWVRNPIDAFIAAEHELRGLTPRPEAAPHVLLRRVYLDLIGLPPTREELHAFLADPSPAAYAAAVERLLASPQYGERWGRHWMDVWRYSDWAGWTDGGQIRDSQPHIWNWRDWIVESLNADRGYDAMVLEMLAADELAPGDPAALRATGYLARNFKMLSRETWMQDTVNHTAQAFLGLTIGCARCHDHQYDSIGQDEYYRLRAVFEPHNVRLDRIAGEADTAKAGLPRVFDADPAAVTQFFIRGDDRQPDPNRAIAPGVPALLAAASFDCRPVSLPPQAFYPSLAPHVQQETLLAAEKQLADARAALQAALQPADGAAVDPAAAELAGKTLAVAQANQTAIRARIAADNARFAAPQPANAPDLVRIAVDAERTLALLQGEEIVLRSAQQLAPLAAVPPADDAAKNALAEAEQRLAAAREQLAAARAALAEPIVNYTAFGAIYPEQSTGRRTALARWIVDRQNPLAARVAVNHIWARHFGGGLVPTMFDFGQYGRPPSHAALLDWLAVELMEPSTSADGAPLAPGDEASAPKWTRRKSCAPCGAAVSAAWGRRDASTTSHSPCPLSGAAPWSMKHLHRLIVLSAAYRMASTPDEANLALDADNRWLWRFPSRRMEAELVRDAVLYVAGQLDLTRGGPDIDHALGLSVKRRSIYFRHAAEKQMTFLKLFDAAAVTECYERKESIVPQQALALVNSELTLVQSRLLARTLHAEMAGDEDFVRAAFEQVLARPATVEELSTCRQFLAEQATFFAQEQQRLTPAAAEPADGAFPASDPALRSRENLIHVLLNHNDFVTIR